MEANHQNCSEKAKDYCENTYNTRNFRAKESTFKLLLTQNLRKSPKNWLFYNCSQNLTKLWSSFDGPLNRQKFPN